MSDDQSTLLEFMYTIGLFGGGSDALSDYAENGETPQVVLDFVNETYAKAGTVQSAYSDVATFARASTATYFNSSGTLTSASSGTPRIGSYLYSGAAWVNKGLALESEARTNVQTYSNDFTNATYDKVGLSVTAADTTGIDGTASGSKITSTKNGTQVYLGDGGLSISSGTQYVSSVYAKAGNTNYICMTMGLAAFPTVTFIVDLSDGTVDTASGSIDNYSVQDVGNGWYRCSLAVTAGANATNFIMVCHPSVTGGTRLSGVNGDYIYITEMQQEVGGVPSSQMPTTSSTATRAAETLTIAAANMSYSSTAMSFQMEGNISYTDNGLGVDLTGDNGEALFYTWRADSSNYIGTYLHTNAAFTGLIVGDQEASGTRDAVNVPSAEYTPAIEVAYNISTRNTSGAINTAVDGTAGTADTTPTALPDLSATDMKLGLVSGSAGASQHMGHVGLFRHWNVDIGDAGIASAST